MYHNKDWLRHHYMKLELTTGEMGRLAGCSRQLIRHWLRKCGIPMLSLSEAKRRSWKRESYHAKQSAAQRGQTRSAETRRNVSKAKRNPSAETRHKMSVAKQNPSAEARQRISAAAVRRWEAPGYREAHSGPNSHHWQGGITKKPYPVEFSPTFKRKIRERDDYACAVCKLPGKCVHHINYIKDDTIPENCITLCRSCHTATNLNRDYWQPALVHIMQARSSFAEVACH